MVGRREAVAATALFAAAALRGSLGFVAGPSRGAEESRSVGLRGSTAGKPSSIPAASEASLPAAGLLALGTVAAAAGLRRREQSAVTMQATRTQWYRKVKRISGDRAMFDVTVPKPMGLKLEPIPDFKKGGTRGIGIVEIVKGGNADQLNKKVCYTEEDSGMWVLEGDRVIGVDGVDCAGADLDGIIELVQQNTGDAVKLTLVRNTRKGPIKVIMMPGGETATVRRNSRLSAAAEFAFGKELKYGCIDGWCGTCWHRERTTDGIFKPCCDMLTADWDNVMPLVLSPKPEKAGDSTLLKPRGV
eukprot:gb/GFBE01056976.1/.p1 GENE.gb/GFBE01056976.1/~~gb/GFBE01056976.1/.p1  ORF type:complete len:302 (+),score=67.83 gb/GFBE01056976.1/:1-906(+)